MLTDHTGHHAIFFTGIEIAVAQRLDQRRDLLADMTTITCVLVKPLGGKEVQLLALAEEPCEHSLASYCTQGIGGGIPSGVGRQIRQFHTLTQKLHQLGIAAIAVGTVRYCCQLASASIRRDPIAEVRQIAGFIARRRRIPNLHRLEGGVI